MGTKYPGAVDDNTSLPNPSASDSVNNANPLLNHNYQHDTVNDALKALETKVGKGSSTPTASNQLLYSTGSGTSVWGNPTVSGDVTGSFPNLTVPALALKANTSSLATVATSGSYTDLSNKPTLPTVPTVLSAFSNDSGYLTDASGLVTAGTNITITGTGTTASPYVINGSAGGSTYDPSTDTLHLLKAGDAMTGNLTFGARINTSQIQLYNTYYGLGIDTQDMILFANTGAGISFKDMSYAGTTVLRIRVGSTKGIIASTDVTPSTTGTYNIGSSSLYWSNIYGTRYNLNSTTYIDGATAGAANLTGSFTANGYARFGANTAPANTTAGDVTMNRLAVGTNVAFATDRFVDIRGNLTSTGAGSVAFANFNPSIVPTVSSPTEFRVLNMQTAISNAAAGGTIGTVRAGYFENRIGGGQDGNIALGNGIYAQGLTLDTSSYATPVASGATGGIFNGLGRPSGTATATVVTVQGLQAQSISSTGIASVTTARGINILDATTGNTIATNIGLDIGSIANGTTNYAIRTGTGINSLGDSLGLLTAAPTHTLTLASTSTGVALYNTSDQTTNIERIQMGWSSNSAYLTTFNLGTGTARSLILAAPSGPNQTIGNHRLTITSGGATTAAVIASVARGDVGGIIMEVGHTSTGTTGFGSSSANQVGLLIDPTVSQTGTATYTALKVNVTETTLGGTANYLADYQVGGTSKVSIDNAGKLATTALKIGTSSTTGYVWTATDTTGNGSWQAVGAASGYITSLTTTGTSGPATVTSGVLNIPQYTGGSGGGISKGFAVAMAAALG